MERDVQVFVLTRGPNNERIRLPVIVSVTDGETVADVTQKVIEKAKLPGKKVRILFNGKELAGSSAIDALQLGLQTLLVAVVDATLPPKTLSQANGESATSNNTGSYFVYCKSCGQLHQGKLRIYCKSCDASAIVLWSEPSSWDDVLDASVMTADCLMCESKQPCRVIFKCTNCSEAAAVLKHVKRNRYDVDCIVCSNRSDVIVSLACGHASCIGCFSAYIECALKDWLFVRKPAAGFTITCPMFGCPAFVEDPHHFYLMGKEGYKKFQRQATECYLNLLQERQYCPFPECGAGFTVELLEDEHLVCCPECTKVYCVICRDINECKCKVNVPDASMELIKTISKPCPSCNVPTQRNGGCSHISCTQCRADWCFICSKPWSVDCQWDHWFD